jgi:hypothetical protein
VWPAGSVTLTLAAGAAEVDVRVVSEGRPLVRGDGVAPLPRPGTLDLRGEGLWLSFVDEAPGRWTIALEGFALQVEDPDDELGIPTPLGLDLEHEAGHLHGELLTDLGVEPVDCPATFTIDRRA